MKMPLVPFLAALTAGIVTGNFLYISNHYLLICLFIVFVLLLATTLKKWKFASIGLLISSLFFIGILNINLCLYPEPGPNHIIHYITTDHQVVEGVISETPEISTDKTDITVSATAIIRNDVAVKVEGLVLLSVRNPQTFKYGDYVRFRVRLKSPHNFNNPGGFDYEKHLRYKGVSVRGFMNDPSNMVTLRENQGNVLKAHLEIFRGRLKKLIRDNSLSPDGEIIQAMILGDQKEIPKDVMDKFNKTGTTHIIAISGFNIGIITVLSIFVIRLIMKFSTYLLLRFNINAVSAILSIIPVVIFTFIAGMGMSVVRAAIMALTFMIAIILGKERDLYNTLALAAIIILAISPQSLFDISFQLSFAAVWSILFMTPGLMKWFPVVAPEAESGYSLFTQKTVHNILTFFIVSVSATVGTLPLIVFYFNRVSSIALLANAMVVPVLGIVAIPVCMAIIIAAPISAVLAVFFIHLSSFLVRISVAMVDFLASLPGSSFFLSTPALPEISLYYCFLICGVKLMDFRHAKKEKGEETSIRNLFLWRAAFVVLLLIILVDVLYLNMRDMFEGNLKVTAIDIGQGSSTLVQFPKGGRMLIDGGGFTDGSFDVGRYVLAPYLWHERISKIDIVVLTHPHPDHLNGLIYILSNFAVEEVWTNGDSSESETHRQFMKIIRDKGIHYRSLSDKSESVKIQNVVIDIMNPPKRVENQNESSRKFEDENNRSVVLKMTFGNVRFLFPADISEPAESRLIRSGRDIKSQILFIPHHGGLASSTESFIRCVHPEIAVVSCGTDNIYHFPHPDVLKRYSLLATRLFRTDRNGAVGIVTDGEKIIMNPFLEIGGRHGM